MGRAGLTAERVTVAGAELADEVGLDHVTMSQVARRLGVKDASLYTHVRNLEDLRGRIALLAADEKTILIAEATAGRAGKEALVAYANAWRTYAHRHPGRYTATQTPLRIDPELAAAAPGPRRAVELMKNPVAGAARSTGPLRYSDRQEAWKAADVMPWA